ncbi:MAG: IS630 family transposase [Aquisalimonadaceae bacterium]
MWNAAAPLALSAEDREQLRRLVRGRQTVQKMVLRARIVLLANQGLANCAIAKALETNRNTVLLWRRRFGQGGLAALNDAPRSGRKRRLSADLVQRVVMTTLQEHPVAATHWSTRTLAMHLGVSKMTVQRIWKANRLQPHRVQTFKLSRDPRFVEKLRDIVGLYLNPPEHALVLCVDEKSQIQALERTQPGLPMKKGRCATMTHDYKRHGTTTLFAALNVLDGSVIGSCSSRHRHQEYLRFLRKLDRETPRDLDLHLVVDNYATHKHDDVDAWLAKHPRFTVHFTPTSSSWLNLVERWFREITDKRIRRGVFRSVAELEAAITEYLNVNNAAPKPFIWTASAEKILDKVARAAKAYGLERRA